VTQAPRHWLAGAAAAALAFFAAAPAPSAQPIVISDLGIAADAPFYIGIEAGYFAAHKVEVKLERMTGGAQGTAPLSTNQVQVVGGGVSAALFNAFARDWPVRIVMARTRDVPGFSSDTLVMRSDLRDSVKTLADLKGKKIALNAPAGVFHFMMDDFLRRAGLTLNDIEIVSTPWPNLGPAFETKAIDGGTMVEPFVTQYDERGIAFPFKRAAEVLTDPPLEVSVILYNKDWMDQKPEQAKAFTVAYLKGVRDYYDAMRGGPKRKQVIDVLVKYTALKNAALYDKMQWTYMDPNAEISLPGLRDQLAFYRRQGIVKDELQVEKMIDTKLLEAALAELGRVQAN